jgi:cation diffusion facilitator CzcD-associated flavoprotein CzcO
VQNVLDTHVSISTEDEAKPLDVLIVGAGISGICAARYMRVERPDDSFLVVDENPTFGGTWYTHKYPGIRSDSDLYTFGFKFKPWIGPPIASGQEIMDYLHEAIDENDLAARMRFQSRVETADWHDDEGMWHVRMRNRESGQAHVLRARFIWMCQGYYRHSEGYTPDWEGFERYKGEVIHPQAWPEDFDGTGKSVVVIGSGATAATLIPSLAKLVDKVTMLQRSPTYLISEVNKSVTADKLRKLEIPETWIHEIVRREYLQEARDFQKTCFQEPEVAREKLLSDVKARVGDNDYVDANFTPGYLPWRQRIARVPDGDLFEAIKAGKAFVVTAHIDHFEEDGIVLTNGEKLKADVIITATGFQMSAFGDVAFSLDGEPLDMSETVGYRGLMFTGVPNFAWTMGYFRFAWTLRAELISQFMMRLFKHMRETGADKVLPQLPESQKNMEVHPWIDDQDFSPGYLKRGVKHLPKRGDTNEWKISQDYWSERKEFDQIDLDGSIFNYRRPTNSLRQMAEPQELTSGTGA